MKSKILFAFFVCCLLGTKLSAQCSADIDHNQNVASPTVTFWTDSVPSDSLLLGAYTYTWSFGDGTGGSGHQTSHTYPVAATAYYDVCLTRYDTITQCTSTTCDSILVTGTNCSTTITYTSIDSLFTFSDSTTGVAPFSYDWTIDGSSAGTSTSASVNGVIQDSLGGLIPVCIIVTDASGCQATTCINVSDTTNVPSCANFATSISYNPHDSLYVFQANNSNAVGVCSYIWTYDNVNEGYAGSIGLVMPNSLHTVCVYVTDSLGCNASACVNIDDSINGPNCSTTISYSAVDSLYTFATSNAGVAPFTYSWTLNGLVPGNATASSLSAVLDSAGALLNACVVVTDATGCIATDCATAIDSAGGGGSCQAGFTIVADTASADTGTYIGYNTSTGSYGSDILWSFGDGTTSTSPYPSHTYATAGLYTICLTVGTAGTSCYSTYCDSSFYVNRSLLLMSQFIIMPPAGIQTVSGNANSHIYPNPVSNELNITNTSKVDHERILNAEGQVVFETATNASKIDVSRLSSGIYILELSSAGSVSRTKFVKD